MFQCELLEAALRQCNEFLKNNSATKIMRVYNWKVNLNIIKRTVECEFHLVVNNKQFHERVSEQTLDSRKLQSLAAQNSFGGGKILSFSSFLSSFRFVCTADKQYEENERARERKIGWADSSGNKLLTCALSWLVNFIAQRRNRNELRLRKCVQYSDSINTWVALIVNINLSALEKFNFFCKNRGSIFKF